MRVRFVFALTIFVASVSSAKEISNVGRFLAEHRSLRQAVENRTGKYSKLTPANRETLIAAQDEIFVLLNNTRSTSDMSDVKLRQLSQADARVETTVAGLDPRDTDVKTVCKREKRVGSNRPETICRKLSAADRGEARDSMRQMQTRQSASGNN